MKDPAEWEYSNFGDFETEEPEIKINLERRIPVPYPSSVTHPSEAEDTFLMYLYSIPLFTR